MNRTGLSKFRVYALIHGPILPLDKIFDCEIKKMSFEEQKERNFTPIQGVFSEDVHEYKTYVTSLPYVDPMKIKSEHIVFCDIEERDENAALGGSARRIDKLCRYLSIAQMRDLREKHKKDISVLAPYYYQVNKVYLLQPDGKESDIELSLKSSGISYPNRPEANVWRVEDTSEFLSHLFDFHDETFELAAKYLYKFSIGFNTGNSPEKIALDNFKSIEIIVRTFGGKDWGFKKKLDVAVSELGLTPEEKASILKLWGVRSEFGDVAHPAMFDQAERYPNQWPLPSNVSYTGYSDTQVAADVLWKYLQYKKNFYKIEIEEVDVPEEEGALGAVNTMWESNRLFFSSNEKNKIKLKQKVKVVFSQNYGIDENNITVNFGATKKIVILKTRY